ncbi:hypothetical protein [Roseobacter sp. HKCCA0434]|uniref:hypothetical protein n=1 Tax=Roseobacter sp. HKCCA0434 TaxID=3079297 RepID=UPI002905F60B|nr:hypothetical protein [Roseobacter sp. HKCCA0434]
MSGPAPKPPETVPAVTAALCCVPMLSPTPWLGRPICTGAASRLRMEAVASAGAISTSLPGAASEGACRVGNPVAPASAEAMLSRFARDSGSETFSTTSALGQVSPWMTQ